MKKIFIIEDELAIATELEEQLKNWGYDARKVEDFERVIEEFKDYNPDLVLMDIKLPFLNGFIWCERIREFSKTPIIFLTSASDSLNLITAINHGGDDFISKPFEIQVLIAKIKALLRRTYEFELSNSILEYKGVILDTDNMTVKYEEKVESLTKNEFLILEILMENINKVISRNRIMDKLWNTDSFIDDNTLTVNINRLRKKLELIGIQDLIKTKKGMGYIIQ
ncbi:response regulator transcription factor [Miniphocaeibacter halophilus]|uniref:Response regulator transcription factor n=1 Tax=Miniphocaeibacter halophilus TaxID=2931922 RepID=A0AC61MQ19_9FIRM|nr:response regulator transcription factor [Miniphocaeibacter halophilus]QQK07019.1 response regulator transcription factor [Miniphocaeibacter halophilus]